MRRERSSQRHAEAHESTFDVETDRKKVWSPAEPWAPNDVPRSRVYVRGAVRSKRRWFLAGSLSPRRRTERRRTHARRSQIEKGGVVPSGTWARNDAPKAESLRPRPSQIEKEVWSPAGPGPATTRRRPRVYARDRGRSKGGVVLEWDLALQRRAEGRESRLEAEADRKEVWYRAGVGPPRASNNEDLRLADEREDYEAAEIPGGHVACDERRSDRSRRQPPRCIWMHAEGERASQQDFESRRLPRPVHRPRVRQTERQAESQKRLQKLSSAQQALGEFHRTRGVSLLNGGIYSQRQF